MALRATVAASKKSWQTLEAIVHHARSSVIPTRPCVRYSSRTDRILKSLLSRLLLEGSGIADAERALLGRVLLENEAGNVGYCDEVRRPE